MGQRIVLIEDVHAADIGLPYELGLLHPTGAILDDCLPDVEAKLLRDGKAALEADWLKRGKGGTENKRSKGPAENK